MSKSLRHKSNHLDLGNVGPGVFRSLIQWCCLALLILIVPLSSNIGLTINYEIKGAYSRRTMFTIVIVDTVTIWSTGVAIIRRWHFSLLSTPQAFPITTFTVKIRCLVQSLVDTYQKRRSDTLHWIRFSIDRAHRLTTCINSALVNLFAFTKRIERRESIPVCLQN